MTFRKSWAGLSWAETSFEKPELSWAVSCSSACSAQQICNSAANHGQINLHYAPLRHIKLTNYLSFSWQGLIWQKNRNPNLRRDISADDNLLEALINPDPFLFGLIHFVQISLSALFFSTDCVLKNDNCCSKRAAINLDSDSEELSLTVAEDHTENNTRRRILIIDEHSRIAKK